MKSRGSARVSRPRSSANKVQPNLFCGCFIIARAFRPVTGETPRRHSSSTCPVEIYSQMPQKISICLNRGLMESLRNDDVSVVRARE